MSHKQFVPPEALSALAELLGAGSGMDIKIIPISIDPDSDVSIEDQLEAAIRADLDAEQADNVAKTAAHVMQCDGCRARYDAHIGNVADNKLQPHQLALKQAVQAAQKNAADIDAARQAKVDADQAAAKLRDIAKGDNEALNAEAATARNPIGYMVFHKGRPIPGSFSTDRTEVETKLKMFETSPEIRALRQMAHTLFGLDISAVVKPVFE